MCFKFSALLFDCESCSIAILISSWTHDHRLLAVVIETISLNAVLDGQQVNASFNRRLFPASLMSCWSVLERHQRLQLQKPLWKAISVRDTSPEVMKYILNLECLVNLEFGKASLPGLDSLRQFAEQCVAKAKSQTIPQRHY